MKRYLTELAKRRLTEHQFYSLRKKWWTLKGLYCCTVYGSNLEQLARLCGTDKAGPHSYAPHYELHFYSLRRKTLNILEIGIGGYDDPRQGGNSLRMWKYYFPNSHIYGIDIHEKSYHNEHRIKTFQGSQNDPAFLEEVVKRIGRLDIVIDDGSHVNEHVITSFKTLFPHLSGHGIYVIEDTQTSYWPKCGGDSHHRNEKTTTVGFFKALVDGLNYEEFKLEDYSPSYFDRHIAAVHFYHNLIFVEKADID